MGFEVEVVQFKCFEPSSYQEYVTRQIYRTDSAGEKVHILLQFSASQMLSVVVYRQTEGPTGPLIASSNPEYLSANDGKKLTVKFWKNNTLCFLCTSLEVSQCEIIVSLFKKINVDL